MATLLPNLLLLTIDTLRIDRLGSYGAGQGLTPNLDRLAAGGARFSQAISGGTWTQSAFPTLLTSSAAAMYGGCLSRLAAGRPSPIAALTQHGYQSAGFASNPLIGPGYGYERGFSYFRELVPAEKEPWLRSRFGGQWLLRKTLTHALRPMPPAKVYVPAAEMNKAVLQWLAAVNGPFMAWVHYMDVHWPYHREDALKRPAHIAQMWRDLAHFHAVCWRGATMSHTDQRHFIELYEIALAYLDEQIGHLLANLARTGRDKDTVVVIVADHGEEFMEHGRWGHWENNLFDEIVRVPLILYSPGRIKPQVVTRQVSVLDIMPTLLELVGCPTPPGVEGYSLLPLLNHNPAGYPRQQALSEMWRDSWHRVGVRREEWKLIWDNRRPKQAALYHLPSDPAEKNNVSQQHPDIVAALQKEVEIHRQRMIQTRPEAGPAAKLEADEALLNRLRGLGYVE